MSHPKAEPIPVNERASILANLELAIIAKELSAIRQTLQNRYHPKPVLNSGASEPKAELRGLKAGEIE